MTTYGLTATGFLPKTYAVIKAELEDAFRAVFGQSIDVSAQSVFGQLIAIFAEREAEVWDACQEVYSAFNPDEATGAALDSVAALTGTIRERAAYSTVTLTLTGTPGATVPAGSEVSVAVTGVKFVTLAAATFVGTFTTVDVAAQAQETGPKVALAGTITVIETPVDGWSAVTNALDAVPGSDIESDADLRERREDELRGGANAALEAIRTNLLAVTGVSEAAVFENITMVTDADGIPAKAVECVVDYEAPATAALVREAIFESVAAGIETHGSVSGTVVDTQGIGHTIEFSEAADIDVWVAATVYYDADHFPLTGAADVLTAILAYGDDLVMGHDVFANAIGATTFAIEGVLNCTVLVGTSNPPLAASVAITLKQIGKLDSARVAITCIATEP